MNARKTKTVLLGKGWLAVQAASWLARSQQYDLRAVVPVLPEPQWTDSLSDWARTNNIAVCQHYRDTGEPPQLAVSVFYDKILPADFIRSCGRVINLHNAPLPKYRGVSPINWALKNGEATHGVTIHNIEADAPSARGIDDGAIISQVVFSIDPPNDEVADVYRRCLLFGKTLFEETMPNLDRITPRPQDETRAVYYSAQQNIQLGERRDWTRGKNTRQNNNGGEQ